MYYSFMKMDSTEKLIVWFMAFIIGGPVLFGIVALIADAMKGC
jgi:ABC-type antimicrobial peptide transport system permease subunit